MTHARQTTSPGKSLPVGWLCNVLFLLYQTPTGINRIFNSVIVVTDRKVLNKQTRNTIKHLEQPRSLANPIEETSEQLRVFLQSGRSIIITTIEKLPVVSESIASMKSRRFAVIIDEVCASQYDKTAGHSEEPFSISTLDKDLTAIDKLILDENNSRGRQSHISYFGFRGTTKNKALEVFETKPVCEVFEHFDLYSMRQKYMGRIYAGCSSNILTL